MKRLSFTVDILDLDPPCRTNVTGRDAWALQQLIEAGEQGCTPLDTPGPRWSGYVFNLRQAGFWVDTIREPHGGPFAGQHARYVLRSRLHVLSEPLAMEGAAHG